MRVRRARRGLTLVEVMTSVTLLAMSVIAAAALFPLSGVVREGSSTTTAASSIVQRKLEQVRRLEVPLLTETGLRTAGVIDEGAIHGEGISTYSFTETDLLENTFRSGDGWITIAVLEPDVREVTVGLRWLGVRGQWRQITARSLVVNKSVWLEE